MTSFLKTPAMLYLLAFLFLLPALIYTWNMSLNGDTAWLLIAAGRWLDGGHMLSDIYENNPPLSMLLHVPAVLISHGTGLPLYYSAYIFFFALIGLSAWKTNALLRKMEFIAAPERLAILCGFLAGATIIPSISFGERDHIIFLGLVPFILLQMLMLWNIPVSRKCAWPVFLLGSMAILIRPHFGIVPACFMLWRVIKTRKIQTLFGPDFFILGGATLAYIASVYLFFPDYVHGILPEVMRLYLSTKNIAIALPQFLIYLVVFSIFLGLEMGFSPLRDKKRGLMTGLYMAALLCLIPYAVQMKGFYYHLIPALGFFFMALAYSMQSYIAQYINRENIRNGVSIAAIFIFAYFFQPPLPAYPTHSEYKTLPLAQALQKYCPAPCTYFAFHNSIEILSQTTLYTGAAHASRFPSLWFLPPLHYGRGLDEAEQDALKDRFATYIAEDIARYQPSVLFIMKNLRFEEDVDFDLISFFSGNAAFRKAFASYRPIDSFTMNQREYLRGTGLDQDFFITYDVMVPR